MKILSFLLAIILLGNTDSLAMTEQEEKLMKEDPTVCKQDILEYYGLAGLEYAIQPDVNNNATLCNGMQTTCCQKDDFEKTKQMWNEDVHRVKGYLSKMFRIIQKIVMVQTSFIQVATKVVTTKNDSYACKSIDTSFFNAPIPFDEIYSYIKIAMQSMAIIQKGFYCTLCDAKNHRFMGFKSEYSPMMIALSSESCSEMINYFKEFIKYKMYYLDPFIMNANNLFNCYYGTDKYRFEVDYKFRYPQLKNCLESVSETERKEACENVCLEFKFGSSSHLFVGDLYKYEKFLNDLIEFGEAHNIPLELSNDDLNDSNEDTDFFKPTRDDEEFDHHSDTYNLSQMQVVIFNNGIDLFNNAENSNYPLEGFENNHYNEGGTLEQQDIPENSEEDNVSEEMQQAAKLKEETEKLEQLSDDQKPSTEELNQLEADIQKKENMRVEMTLETGELGDVDYATDERYNDFGQAGRLESIKIVSTALFMIYLIALDIKF